MRSKFAAAAMAVAGVMTTAVTTVAPVTPAFAAYADCDHALGHRSVTGPDLYRAGAYCYQVGRDSKVRAWLQRDGGPDYYSVWFTGTYIWRYTNWYTCYAGCDDSYQVSPT